MNAMKSSTTRQKQTGELIDGQTDRQTNSQLARKLDR